MPGVACTAGLPASLDVSASGLAGTLPADAALWRALASLALISVAGNRLTVRLLLSLITCLTSAMKSHCIMEPQ